MAAAASACLAATSAAASVLTSFELRIADSLLVRERHPILLHAVSQAQRVLSSLSADAAAAGGGAVAALVPPPDSGASLVVTWQRLDAALALTVEALSLAALAPALAEQMTLDALTAIAEVLRASAAAMQGQAARPAHVEAAIVTALHTRFEVTDEASSIIVYGAIVDVMAAALRHPLAIWCHPLVLNAGLTYLLRVAVDASSSRAVQFQAMPAARSSLLVLLTALQAATARAAALPAASAEALEVWTAVHGAHAVVVAAVHQLVTLLGGPPPTQRKYTAVSAAGLADDTAAVPPFTVASEDDSAVVPPSRTRARTRSEQRDRPLTARSGSGGACGGSAAALAPPSSPAPPSPQLLRLTVPPPPAEPMALGATSSSLPAGTPAAALWALSGSLSTAVTLEQLLHSLHPIVPYAATAHLVAPLQLTDDMGAHTVGGTGFATVLRSTGDAAEGVVRLKWDRTIAAAGGLRSRVPFSLQMVVDATLGGVPGVAAAPATETAAPAETGVAAGEAAAPAAPAETTAASAPASGTAGSRWPDGTSLPSLALSVATAAAPQFALTCVQAMLASSSMRALLQAHAATLEADATACSVDPAAAPQTVAALHAHEWLSLLRDRLLLTWVWLGDGGGMELTGDVAFHARVASEALQHTRSSWFGGGGGGGAGGGTGSSTTSIAPGVPMGAASAAVGGAGNKGAAVGLLVPRLPILQGVLATIPHLVALPLVQRHCVAPLELLLARVVVRNLTLPARLTVGSAVLVGPASMRIVLRHLLHAQRTRDAIAARLADASGVAIDPDGLSHLPPKLTPTHIIKAVLASLHRAFPGSDVDIGTVRTLVALFASRSVVMTAAHLAVSCLAHLARQDGFVLYLARHYDGSPTASDLLRNIVQCALAMARCEAYLHSIHGVVAVASGGAGGVAGGSSGAAAAAGPSGSAGGSSGGAGPGGAAGQHHRPLRMPIPRRTQAVAAAAVAAMFRQVRAIAGAVATGVATLPPAQVVELIRSRLRHKRQMQAVAKAFNAKPKRGAEALRGSGVLVLPAAPAPQVGQPAHDAVAVASGSSGGGSGSGGSLATTAPESQATPAAVPTSPSQQAGAATPNATTLQRAGSSTGSHAAASAGSGGAGAGAATGDGVAGSGGGGQRQHVDVVALLLSHASSAGFHPAAIGEFLGTGESADDDARRRAHVSLFAEQFQGLSLTSALRLYLRSFRLPGEAQMIDRVLQGFATMAHTLCHDGASLPSIDATYLLSFSIIMLNTDLHNPNIKPERKMTVEGFIRNNTYYTDEISHGRRIPEDVLRRIYATVKEHPIAPPLLSPTNTPVQLPHIYGGLTEDNVPATSQIVGAGEVVTREDWFTLGDAAVAARDEYEGAMAAAFAAAGCDAAAAGGEAVAVAAVVAMPELWHPVVAHHFTAFLCSFDALGGPLPSGDAAPGGAARTGGGGSWLAGFGGGGRSAAGGAGASAGGGRRGSVSSLTGMDAEVQAYLAHRLRTFASDVTFPAAAAGAAAAGGGRSAPGRDAAGAVAAAPESARARGGAAASGMTSEPELDLDAEAHLQALGECAAVAASLGMHTGVSAIVTALLRVVLDTQLPDVDLSGDADMRLIRLAGARRGHWDVLSRYPGMELGAAVPTLGGAGGMSDEETEGDSDHGRFRGDSDSDGSDGWDATDSEDDESAGGSDTASVDERPGSVASAVSMARASVLGVAATPSRTAGRPPAASIDRGSVRSAADGLLMRPSEQAQPRGGRIITRARRLFASDMRAQMALLTALSVAQPAAQAASLDVDAWSLLFDAVSRLVRLRIVPAQALFAGPAALGRAAFLPTHALAPLLQSFAAAAARGVHIKRLQRIAALRAATVHESAAGSASSAAAVAAPAPAAEAPPPSAPSAAAAEDASHHKAGKSDGGGGGGLSNLLFGWLFGGGGDDGEDEDDGGIGNGSGGALGAGDGGSMDGWGELMADAHELLELQAEIGYPRSWALQAAASTTAVAVVAPQLLASAAVATAGEHSYSDGESTGSSTAGGGGGGGGGRTAGRGRGGSGRRGTAALDAATLFAGAIAAIVHNTATSLPWPVVVRAVAALAAAARLDSDEVVAALAAPNSATLAPAAAKHTAHAMLSTKTPLDDGKLSLSLMGTARYKWACASATSGAWGASASVGLAAPAPTTPRSRLLLALQGTMLRLCLLRREADGGSAVTSAVLAANEVALTRLMSEGCGAACTQRLSQGLVSAADLATMALVQRARLAESPPAAAIAWRGLDDAGIAAAATSLWRLCSLAPAFGDAGRVVALQSLLDAVAALAPPAAPAGGNAALAALLVRLHGVIVLPPPSYSAAATPAPGHAADGARRGAVAAGGTGDAVVPGPSPPPMMRSSSAITASTAAATSSLLATQHAAAAMEHAAHALVTPGAAAPAQATSTPYSASAAARYLDLQMCLNQFGDVVGAPLLPPREPCTALHVLAACLVSPFLSLADVNANAAAAPAPPLAHGSGDAGAAAGDGAPKTPPRGFAGSGAAAAATVATGGPTEHPEDRHAIDMTLATAARASAQLLAKMVDALSDGDGAAAPPPPPIPPAVHALVAGVVAVFMHAPLTLQTLTVDDIAIVAVDAMHDLATAASAAAAAPAPAGSTAVGTLGGGGASLRSASSMGIGSLAGRAETSGGGGSSAAEAAARWRHAINHMATAVLDSRLGVALHACETLCHVLMAHTARALAVQHHTPATRSFALDVDGGIVRPVFARLPPPVPLAPAPGSASPVLPAGGSSSRSRMSESQRRWLAVLTSWSRVVLHALGTLLQQADATDVALLQGSLTRLQDLFAICMSAEAEGVGASDRSAGTAAAGGSEGFAADATAVGGRRSSRVDAAVSRGSAFREAVLETLRNVHTVVEAEVARSQVPAVVAPLVACLGASAPWLRGGVDAGSAAAVAGATATAPAEAEVAAGVPAGADPVANR